MAKMYDPVELKAFAETFLADPILKMGFLAVLRNAPTVEADKVVRCGNCIHRHRKDRCQGRPMDWFCADGESRTGQVNCKR